MEWKQKIWLSCEQATELVEKKRDGKLSVSERIGLRLHLAYCSLCALFFEQAARIDQAAQLLAGRVQQGDTSYHIDPARKAALDKELKEQLKK